MGKKKHDSQDHEPGDYIRASFDRRKNDVIITFVRSIPSSYERFARSYEPTRPHQHYADPNHYRRDAHTRRPDKARLWSRTSGGRFFFGRIDYRNSFYDEANPEPPSRITPGPETRWWYRTVGDPVEY